MDLDFAILADGATSRPDGKLDMYGAGFDTIFAAAVPALHQQLTLAIRVLIDRHEAEHDHVLRVILMSPDGPEMHRVEARIDAVTSEAIEAIPAGRQAGIMLILNLGKLVFAEYGTYHFAMYWDGNRVREPITLIVAPIPDPV